MGDRNDLVLIDLLESDWLGTLLGPWISFAELRNLSLSNESAQAAVRTLIGSWPEQTQELVGTWCCKTPLHICGINIADEAGNKGLFFKYRHPAPIIRFQFDSLTYDEGSKRLLGHPWSEVGAKNLQPRALGRVDPSVCSANESGSIIFYCGGRIYTDGDGDSTRWLEKDDLIIGETSTAAIFNIDTGKWTQLPHMPELRSEAGIFRIGTRIFVLGGGRTDESGDLLQIYHSTLCFDLEQEQWVDSGIEEFPGEAFTGFAIVVIDGSNVVVAGGRVDNGWHQDHGDFFRGSRQAFSLNTNTGVWTPLMDLPETGNPEISTVATGHFLKLEGQVGGSVVVMRGRSGHTNATTWTRLLPNGEWETLSDLCGSHLRAIQLGTYSNKIFSENTWIALPPHHDSSGSFGVHVEDMQLCWDSATPVV